MKIVEIVAQIHLTSTHKNDNKILPKRGGFYYHIGKVKMDTWLNKIGPNAPLGVSLFEPYRVS